MIKRAIKKSSRIVVLGLLLIGLWLFPGGAIALPSSTFTEQSAILTGPKADAPIPLYLRPAANQPNVGYGKSGDAVTVLEQIASFLPEADQNSSWNHIRLDTPPYTEGWVQGKFLSGLATNSSVEGGS